MRWAGWRVYAASCPGIPERDAVLPVTGLDESCRLQKDDKSRLITTGYKLAFLHLGLNWLLTDQSSICKQA